MQQRHRAVFLTKPPFNNKEPLLDNFTTLVFLSTLSDSKFHFSQTKKSEVTIVGQKFTNFIEISHKGKPIFILRYQKTGNYFIIQILNICVDISFKKNEILLNKNKRKVYIYNNPIIANPNTESLIKIQKNAGISEISDFFNNVSVDKTAQNQLTASIFYSVSPFNVKTITRNKNKLINPNDSIEGILNGLGGMFFKFSSNDEISLDEYPFQIIAWLTPYLESIIESEDFDLMTTIELDSTFDALDPYTICIPVIIYRNSGIPLGMLISISESASLYSLFFESLKELDKKKPNPHFSYYEKFVVKKYLTDEHKSFVKLQKKYNLDMYNCFVHLIRTIGANSLLAYFLSDLLFTYSEKEWNNNLIRMCYTFQNLYKEKSLNADVTRFDKVAQVLGQDAEGNPIEKKLSYSPIYLRSADRIPTCTNHIESLHMQINQLTKGSKSLPLRFGIICKYILDRTKRINKSVIDNLKNYINTLKKKAANSASSQKHTVGKCNCAKKFYFSQLYCIEVPCIHDICSENFDESLLIETIKFNSLDFLQKNYTFSLEVFEIVTDMKFNKKKVTNSNDTNTGSLQTTSSLAFNPDYEIEDDPISYIIKHTEYQLATVIRKHNINLAISSLQLYDEMMSDAQLIQEKENNQPSFWAMYQMRLWKNVLKGRQPILI